MKALTVLIVAIGCVLSADAQTRSVLEKGPHHTLYSSSDGNPSGTPTLVLETGLHYWSPKTKEWLPTDPRFSINATRDAFVANKTLGQIRASAQINTAGAITVSLDPQDPARQLVTSPVAIALEEPTTGASLVVGTITNSLGAPVEGSANQIIYEDCFAGVCASYVVEVQRGTYSADVLFTGKFDVRDWGFTTNARVQVISEIYGPPPDSRIRRPLYIEQDQKKVAQAARLGLSLDIIDETLGWGNLVMAEGSAYTAATATATNGASVRVAKQIESGDGRLFLVESLSFASLQQQFLNLPECKPPGGHASLNRPKDAKFRYAAIPRLPSAAVVASEPPSPPAISATTPAAILPLQARLVRKPTGVWIDYIANLGGTLSTAVTFQSSTNILITGGLYLNGAVTIEPIVVKYKANAFMQINSTLTLKNFGQFRGAQFTAVDDNSVGDTCAGIPGSGYTGVIASTGYANPAIYASQSSLSLTNCRFSYAKLAVQCITPLASSSTFNFSHSQLVNCITGIQLSLASSGCGCGGGGCGFGCGVTIGLNVNNCLMANVSLPFNICLANPPLTLRPSDCTLDRATRIAQVTSGGFSLYAVNCIFANITNTSSGVTFGGTHNGFYHSAQQFGTSQSVVTNSPFLSVGAGNYYLTATSGFTNAGTTTGIPAWLPADLRQRTTCPPTVICDALLTNNQILSPQVPRDTNVCSLGMHYDPIDWALGWVLLTNATLTVNPGTVIAAFGTNAGGTNIAAYGLAIGQNAALQCQGAPNTPNWFVAYNTVQEQGTNSGGWLPPTSGLLLSEFQGLTPGSVINCRFTDWSVPSLDEPAFNAVTNSGPLTFQDCEFHGGKLLTSRPTIDLANCLLERVYANLSSADGNALYIRNCLFYGGTFNFAPSVTNALVKDNLFDQTVIPTNTAIYITYDGGYNAYVTNNSRLLPFFATDQILTVSLAYQTGPLGNYYYPTNGLSVGLTNLFDTGSTWALDDGLFYYTTTINQIPEGGTLVDIGYHYVAIDPNAGQPYDWDHDGLPDYLYGAGSFFDWWLIQWFGRTDLDPYAQCPSGDGWTLLQAYQNGWSPNLFYTPPPPRNVAARLDSTGTNVVITWESGGGPVTNYVIQVVEIDPGSGPLVGTVGQTNASAFALTYCPGFSFLTEPTYALSYFVSAYFTDGSHADSVQVPLWRPSLTPTLSLVRGPAAELYLAVSSPLPDTCRIRLFWYSHQTLDTRWVDVYATNVVNGILRIPTEQMPGYAAGSEVDAETIATDVDFGEISYLFPYVAPEEVPADSGGPPYRFVDTRSHLKENLKFLLQSATLSQTFSYVPGGLSCGYSYPESVWFPETEFARPPSPTNYEYSGFHVFSSNLNYAVMQEFRPAQENYLWRNLAYDPGDFDSAGNWTNGVGYATSYHGLRWLCDANYQFTPTNSNPIPLAFSSTNYQYLYARWVNFSDLNQFSADIAEAGVLINADYDLYVPGGVHNIYGLSVNSVLIRNGTPLFSILAAGGPAGPPYAFAKDGDFFCAFQTPALQTMGYYFTSQSRYLSSDYNGWPGSGPLAGPAPPLPGSPTFSETSTSPLLITGIAQPITVSGWAKLAITNGYTGKYAYLEQYFTNAYTIDASGNVTTNSAGLLSPYGEFFPMQPGPAALVTMPDIDTGQRGTGVVNVIKLQLDVNHDGTMDLSFAGPDNTSQTRPYTFWINNDIDRIHLVDVTDVEEDDLERIDSSVWSGQGGNGYLTDVTDENFQDGTYGPWQPAIPCTRDLEDYTRLWMPGLSSLMAVMPTNYTVKLTMTGDAQVRLFRAVETDGGTNYLFDLTNAANQVSQSASLYVGLLTSSSPIILTGRTNNLGEHFIWCGAHRGSGQMDLQVLDGTQNLVADTAAYVQLSDIKEMYERWTVGDNGSKAPTNTAYTALEGLPTGVSGFRYGPPETTNTPYILHVHGWNMPRFDKDRYGETMYKRLYWQGYQGRCGIFRWPTQVGITTYNPSEFNAWRSGEGLRSLLVYLNAKYPGQVRLTAHSMGNVVAGEALRTNATLVAVYVAMQGAVPSGAYDQLAPFRAIPAPYADGTPELYRYYPVSSPARQYFYQPSGAAAYINFYNPRDWALDLWIIDQNVKPEAVLENYSYDLSTDTFYHNQYRPDVRVLTCPTNTFELFAYCVEGQCYALGAQADVGGVFSTEDQVNLDTAPYDFGMLHKGHSGQFRSTNMKRWTFWEQLLFNMDLKKPQ